MKRLDIGDSIDQVDMRKHCDGTYGLTTQDQDALNNLSDSWRTPVTPTDTSCASFSGGETTEKITKRHFDSRPDERAYGREVRCALLQLVRSGAGINQIQAQLSISKAGCPLVRKVREELKALSEQRAVPQKCKP